jgi:Asp-tRNA(Asn)/Glu-tRNA(Gln) amidotransferase A subunit family amidase
MAVSDDDICYLPIGEISRRLVAGWLSSLTLTQAFLGAAHGDHFKNFACVMAESALADAEKADSERGAGLVRSALRGVPVAIKDLIDSKGITAAGMTIRAGIIPDEDTTVLQRLRLAGADIVSMDGVHHAV